MAGSWQKAEWYRQWTAQGRPSTWREQFAHLSGRKVTCLICGSRGYDGNTQPTGWQVSCLIGHKEECPTCGAPVKNLGSHLNCKSHHTCCGQHTRTQYQRLMEER